MRIPIAVDARRRMEWNRREVSRRDCCPQVAQFALRQLGMPRDALKPGPRPRKRVALARCQCGFDIPGHLTYLVDFSLPPATRGQARGILRRKNSLMVSRGCREYRRCENRDWHE